jgi:hypothetical protein
LWHLRPCTLPCCGSEHESGWKLLNHELEEGRSWPFEQQLTLDEFRAYFLSHAAFVVRDTKGPSLCSPQQPIRHSINARFRRPWSSGQVLGAFYIKPNFPGRCSHICNGGWVAVQQAQGGESWIDA